MTFDSQASAAPRKGMAIVALVLAILTFFCLGPLAAVPAVILAIIVLVRTGREPQRYAGRGLAITALILSGVGTVFSCILAFFMLPMVAVMIPAVAQARMAANRTADMSNMRQVMMACLNYSAANRGMFPPHLAATVDYLGAPDPKVFVLRGSGTAPLGSLPSGGDWTTLAPDLEAHCDLIYIGADVRDRVAAGKVVVVYSKDLYPNHGRHLGFADGRVEWVPASELGRYFQESNRVRRSAGLPRVEMDGPPPPPPSGVMRIPAEAGPPEEAGRPRVPVRPPENVRPPAGVRPPERLNPPKETPAELLAAMNTSDVRARRDALRRLAGVAPAPALRAQAMKQIIASLAEKDFRGEAANALKAWALAEDVPQIIAALPTIGDIKGMDGAHERNTVVRKLAELRDPRAMNAIAALVPNFFNRGEAINALLAFGPDGEKTLHPFLENKDWVTAKSVCEALGKSGTAVSLPALEAARTSQTPHLAATAEKAVETLKARNGGAAQP